MLEQTVVVETPETASQDRRLQRTVEGSLVDSVEAAKIDLQERISERICEQFGVIQVSKNFTQEHVKIVKNIPQEQVSERTGEQIRAIEMPKVSYQESV